MPSRALRPCAKSGCGARVARGYCAEHGGNARPRDERLSASRRGYGRSWQRTRRRILAAEPLCRHCEARGRVVAATEVDHVRPLVDGGTNEDGNLQPLCRTCHRQKTVNDQRRPRP